MPGQHHEKRRHDKESDGIKGLRRQPQIVFHAHQRDKRCERDDVGNRWIPLYKRRRTHGRGRRAPGARMLTTGMSEVIRVPTGSEPALRATNSRFNVAMNS
jgi:hypothetical protein